MFGRHVIFEGSLAKKLRFLSFKASFLKEVSQKCLVLELQSFIFAGSLAQKLRKSRTKSLFLSFKASFLKEVSQKSYAFLSFKASFWRKSRRKASFDKII